MQLKINEQSNFMMNRLVALTRTVLMLACLLACAEGESLRIAHATEVQAILEEDQLYQWEASNDLASWVSLGDPIIGLGGSEKRYFSANTRLANYYRVRELSEQWALVWSDEFDGGTIDRAKWMNDVNANGGGNNELQFYTDEASNSRVVDGSLIIEATRESYGGLDGSRDYTSAKLTTKFRGAWKYGRIEVRARLPIGQGIWPAIWMLPQDDVYGTWASSGEIDIVEVIGQEPSTVHSTIHFGGSWPQNQSNGKAYELESGTVADAFHTYSIEWSEGNIQWFIDGEKYHEVSEWNSSGGPFPAPFDQSFYLILNVAVGGNWPGSPNTATMFPARMEVDYVRVYQWAD